MVSTRRPLSGTPPAILESHSADPGVLLEISRAVAATIELKPLLELILEQLELLVPYAGASVDLNEGGMLRQVAVRRPRGPQPTSADTEFSFPLSVFDQLGIPLGEGSAQVIDDVHGTSKEAAQYRSLFGGDLKGSPVEYVRSFIGLPLIARDRIVGTLTMGHDEPGYFTRQHIEMLSPIASQAALAIDNAQLIEQAQSRTRELAALLEVSRAVASTLEPHSLMGVILDQLGAIIDHTGSAVLILKDGELEFVDQRSIAGRRTHIGARLPVEEPTTSLWEAIKSGETVIIDDVRSDEPMAVDYRLIVTAGGVSELPPLQVLRSWMGVPLIQRDQGIGMLTISHAVPAYFKPEHARLARSFADQAAIAIENARLYEQADRGKRELGALLQTSQALASTLELKPLLERILEELRHFVDYAGASVNLLRDGMLKQLAVRRPRGPAVTAEDMERGTPENTFERVGMNIQAGEPLLIDDVHSDSAGALLFRDMYGGTIEGTAVEYIRSFMNLPLLARGELVGVLTVTHEQPGFFRAEHADLLRPLASQAALAIDNARLFEQTQRAAATEERQRLARELHDSVSQALYGIALGARTARTLLDRDEAGVIEPVDYISSLAEAGLAEMRALIFELRPESLETEGLVAAITKQAAALQARHGLSVECKLGSEPDLPLPVKETLYRISQEALHNTVKHASATTATVVLEVSDGRTTVIVQDNGAGFDPQGHFPGHLGLRSMKERAEKSGGSLRIESSPGEGARVVASFSA